MREIEIREKKSVCERDERERERDRYQRLREGAGERTYCQWWWTSTVRGGRGRRRSSDPVSAVRESDGVE
jgi:hypothetical protein